MKTAATAAAHDYSTPQVAAGPAELHWLDGETPPAFSGTTWGNTLAAQRGQSRHTVRATHRGRW